MPLPLEILEELRERFRKENPHLDLPPARSWTQEEIEQKRAEILKEEEIRIKQERIKETAEKKTNVFVRALQKYIDQDTKKR
ncbi:MAG: hypothetical protein ACK6BZ_03715 [Candidatus Kapaibacterium sp.]|jgi:hypothetical protein|nr:hypothetical protein [Candidatus Kapabacteria bacterium]